MYGKCNAVIIAVIIKNYLVGCRGSGE